MNKLLNKSGLILAEALIAIGMLTTAVLILGNIFDSAIQTTLTSKHYLVAQNFASEGVAAVMNIRDSNWLLNPNRPNCWMTKDPDGAVLCDDNSAPQAQVEVDKYYIPKEKPPENPKNGKWYLEEKNIAVPDDFRIYVDTVNKKFYHIDEGLEKTNYFRHIIFQEATSNKVTFDVVVAWGDGGSNMNKVTRTTTLQNYKNE